MEEYRTVAAAAEEEFVEKRSRFIGCVQPVSSEAEAQTFIAARKKQYWDATHNVWAYITDGGRVRRFSDDGEPQGTAGMPTLDVLCKAEVTDCAVVVTRYFGGILLGAGGLVRAYSHAAALALSAGRIVLRRLCPQLRLDCSYAQYGRVAPMIAAAGGTVTDTAFAEEVTLHFWLPPEQEQPFAAALTEYSAGTLAAVTEGSAFRDFPAE